MRVFGGEWGNVMQTLVVVGGLIGLVVPRLHGSTGWLHVTCCEPLQYSTTRDEWSRVTRS
jgi:hypothetical protein